jgi:glycosyltransferase involved in cell wall biosynthesis
VVTNGFDCPSRLHPPDKTVIRAKQTGQQIRVAFLASLSRDKGLDTAIEVARSVIPISQHFSFAFAGGECDSALGIELRDLARCYPDQVSLLGEIDADEKCRLLTESDLLLFPTRYRLEGAPLSVIEALAHGVVPLVTDFAAVAETAGESGIIIRDVDDAVVEILRFSEKTRAARRTIASSCFESWAANLSAAHYRARVASVILADDRSV